MKHLASFLICLLPVCANAQPISGPYVSLGGGLDMRGGEVSQPATDQPSPLARTMHSGGGPVLQGSVGEGFGNGFRVEIEGHGARSQ